MIKLELIKLSQYLQKTRKKVIRKDVPKKPSKKKELSGCVKCCCETTSFFPLKNEKMRKKNVGP